VRSILSGYQRFAERLKISFFREEISPILKALDFSEKKNFDEAANNAV
jgi:hypothetical protein